MTTELAEFKKADGVLEAARALAVRDEDGKGLVLRAVDDWKALLGEVDAHFDPAINQAHGLHKRLLGDKDKIAGPIKAAIRTGKDKVLDYDAEVKRKAWMIEQARLEEIAKREAEAQEALRKAAKAKTPEKAAEILRKADERTLGAIPLPEAAPEPSKTPGTQTRWSAEVLDVKALCAAVAAGIVPVDYVEPCAKMLNAVAVKRKTRDLGIPGVIGVSKTIL
jgi:hypothetical protein